MYISVTGDIVPIDSLINAEQLALQIFLIFSGSKLFSLKQLWSFKNDSFNDL